jgi:AcrR family transcriptional regulator
VTEHHRPYRSRLRDEQAATTRRRIVAAGRDLFIERGYAATTIDTIAERAEVSRKTVFTAVGGKAAVLKLAFDWTLAGDDEPVPIADRPEVRRMMQGTDPAVLLAEWMAMNAAIAGRLAMLYHVLVIAADTDRQAAALLDTVEHQRFSGAEAVVGRLADLGGLRPGLDKHRATAIAELLIDPEPFRRLVLRHGWTPDQYTEHLQRMAAAALLP